MYVLINPSTMMEIGKYSALNFVSAIDAGGITGYVQTNYDEAQGLFLDHTLYRIEGRDGISEEFPSIIVESPSEDETLINLSNGEEQNKAYIDYLSAMTGIDIPSEP